MKYYIEKTTDYTFDEAVKRVTEELSKEGFGILTEINVHKTLKEKLSVDIRKYRILGACNPSKAYKAIQSEDKIGTMLPCNVIVQELENGKIEVSAINPVASMMAIENPNLADFAQEVKEQLERVISAL